MRSRLPLVLLIVLLVGGGIWYFTRDKKTPEERAEELFEEGARLVEEEGKYDDAIGPFKKAVQLDPSHAEAHEALGCCYYAKGDFEAAKRHFAKTLELVPHDGSAAVAYAGCLLKTVKDKDEAWRQANRALRGLTQQGIRDPDIAYNLACLYAENGKPQLALRYLSYAVKKSPNHRKVAKHDRCLDSIRHTEQFKRLVQE